MEARPKWSGTGACILGGLAVVVLIGILGVWGTQSQIAGSVLAKGQLQVKTKNQVVQHPDGGIIRSINVANGSEVSKGAVLISLDDADILTEIRFLEEQIADLSARAARLAAEKDSLQTMPASPHRSDSPANHTYVAQVRLFQSRLTAHTSELKQLAEAVQQTKVQIAGVEAQREAVEVQLEIVSAEIARQVTLEEKGLTRSRDVSTARAQEADLKGRSGFLTAEIGRLRSHIAQIELDRARQKTARVENAMTTLADVSARLREANSHLTALRRKLTRLNITSPIDGIVLNLKVHAIQSVVGPRDPLMHIVPLARDLVVTARVSENDIDQLNVGQEVSLRFLALDTRFTPTVRGTVRIVSADIMFDEIAESHYYEAEIHPLAEDLALLADQQLYPGMPTEAYIRTGDRTPLHILMKPIAGYFYRAFRHD